MSEFTNMTGLSVKELARLVSTAESCEDGIAPSKAMDLRTGAGVPLGRIVNDIGFHLVNGEDGAEELLVDLLADERRPAHFCAYAYLLTNKTELSSDALEAMKEFESNPNMAEVVVMAQDSVHRNSS